MLNQLLQELPHQTNILEATFGLEREGLRITESGQIATTDHPVCLGSRSFHPYIQTDFSEEQLELITPISYSTSQARRRLGAIWDVTQASLAKKEVIWPLSMPPYLQDQDIQVAKLENQEEVAYRKHLVKTYGKKLQSISGLHYNFGLGQNLLQSLFDLSQSDNLVAFKNQVYMKLARQFLNYQWFVTYLFGASPLAEKDFYPTRPQGLARALRASRAYGYSNAKSLHISFSSLEAYINDIQASIDQGQLSLEKEFYSAVRLRGSSSSQDYLKKGISYLEFRNFDIDPFDPLGISQETLDSFHLFLLALLWLDDLEDCDQRLKAAKELNEAVALAGPRDPLPAQADPQPILEAMQGLLDHFHLDAYYQDLVDQMALALKAPERTICGRIFSHIADASLAAFGLKQALAYHQEARQAPYALKGYESMELSTQMLMFDAIQKGIHLEILDEQDQFLKLWHKDHVELVKNGNMTSKDNYVVPLAMANKTVTKKLLDQAGFPTPQGQEFASKEQALRYYPLIAEKPIVVKPKSTNFGLGISIFQKPASQTDYEKALDIAFAEDSAVLVEAFITGTEYRFFTLNGTCQAVLLRLPANVVGDGKHTIKELVALKNQDPLRGSDHRSPLEKIQVGPIEKLMLAQEGYQEETVLAKGVRVQLRRNSNISTGGDSIDLTDQMDQSYKDLAAQMADTIGAWVCGVDLIIADITEKADLNQPNVHCIEVNFNPSMYMHTYPYQGPGQALTPKILQELFPEVAILA
ncbi:bifunctional glutamate--cysteine ligase GshA/glutathione synthetase GshB [Streptococcus pseudoporcinus]|uniref:Glutathione biosynthesis bifunctional protein GshAB n=1 Tax=Streptococcus pseudoporcinus LQ 940-04 TaxID=875093 RepID=G5K9Y8_9STRE|nr:bifunctional glutamate--cysteine ligase GshA/glutathione synthetase GshB [Streptococcus pseudoporcinus]EFR43650.1 glutamate--cysteine ligase/gamma-glutamylcysteine synthetase [Streptococcus pseudoporcinus SPIN 20026]EHI64270.1 glutamate--cysteine ligase/gamma-glutamylcysteine synthetase [Streptococcus pseudoporcinus LQ 940-04]VEF93731.1 bifunctional glutamate--cysteine ligase/glutathione synthetase [Streptococcus pseudoporcinus]